MEAIESKLTMRSIPIMYKKLLPAELRIVEIKGQPMKSSATKVRVDKISVKGLSFLSELLFPISSQITLNFQIFILNEMIELRGTIQSSLRENNSYFYEVVFIKDEVSQTKLRGKLESLAHQFIPLHLRAEYYYNYFSESTYDFKNNQINLLA